MQDSFMNYSLCVLFDECVAGHNESITHKNRYMSFVWFSRVWGQAPTSTPPLKLSTKH